MPKVSNNPDKPLYTTIREGLGLSREKASECITSQYISADRLEKIENRRIQARPDEILAIAEAYRAPSIVNYYCTHDCDIGGKYIQEVKPKELSQIAIVSLISARIFHFSSHFYSAFFQKAVLYCGRSRANMILAFSEAL